MSGPLVKGRIRLIPQKEVLTEYATLVQVSKS